MMRIAFFDLDKTLLDVNSATLWLRRELRQGNMSWWTAIRGAFWVAAYSLGFGRMEPVLLEAILGLKGLKVNEIEARTQRFYDEEVSSHFRPGARQRLREHKEAGDVLVLLTSSSSFLSERVAKELGLDHVLCNRFEVISEGANAVFTGKPSGPLCFGAGKIDHATELATTLDIPLADCTFYTDSYTDLPMLEAAGHPVVVHPDRLLRKEALKRGWTLETWSGASMSLPLLES